MNCAVVILGAGASAGVANGVTPRVEHWQPPLAKELFNTERPHYYGIAERYPGALVIANTLGRHVRSAGVDLESNLRACAKHRSSTIRAHFLDVPPYLRELLATVSCEYIGSPGCYVKLVAALLEDEPHQALFLTLNYDTLLEQALQQVRREYIITSMDDYVHPDRQAATVKLHGSIDWFMSIGEASDLSTWRARVQQHDFARPPNRVVLIPQVGRRSASMLMPHQIHFSGSNESVYPVLTAPLSGKGPMDVVCPESHVLAARRFLPRCTKVLVVGTSGHDADLLDLLASSATGVETIHYVDLQDADVVRSRFEAGIERFRDGRSVHAITSSFEEYVYGKHFRAFLAA